MDCKEIKLQKGLDLLGKSLVLAGLVAGAPFMLFCKSKENYDWRNASRLENNIMYYTPLVSLGSVGAGMLVFYCRDGIKVYRERNKR
jgi:hypothetical protein